MSFQQSEEGAARLHLPKPRREANSFMHLLGWRRSSRTFSDRELDSQLMADLLWSAFGVSNRDGYRTAPSARNWREIDVFVALATGSTGSTHLQRIWQRYRGTIFAPPRVNRTMWVHLLPASASGPCARSMTRAR